MASIADMSLPFDRRKTARQAHVWLAVLLVMVSIASLATGASGTSLWGALHKLVTGAPLTRMERVVLWDIRMPRLILGIVVGATLAVSGAVMQGLFRNPLADPGIVGVTAGAGLGAVSAIVLGGLLPMVVMNTVGFWLVPLAAFIGCWATTLILYRVSTRRGRTSVATMLLAGIAMGALAGALSGVLIYLADDAQLRDLTFWGLGSLAGATWAKTIVAGPVIMISILAATRISHGLNGLAFGEATASHMGIPVQQVKNLAILVVAAGTGAAVAVSGGIGFIGIIVPHLLRLSTGPDHEPLLINAALLGASLLLIADIISRVIVAPAELPIGIVTAILGAPVFLWILLRRRGLVDL
ncbi:iron ABC transporter permease [Sulfitobacter sp. F26169L]|uniref:FecCD family ABC transporter permease n=1 Tax=Sulfitobacter sp. F26169L TaxID=2996015 RepID=UPI0022608C42|nr:iron ABC transporter permease [Sulfitobacter sp. F26169L]MCX7567317.1 iron ABC transporter permease [Sulfitobacter sp. F26169L]